MSAHLRNRLFGTGVGLAALLIAVPVAGQDALSAKATEADRLHDVAMEQYAGTYVAEIALLAKAHAKSSELRTVEDPRAVECTRFQAQLMHMTGDLDEALDHMERAAVIALIQGDDFTAATSFLEAALVAAEGSRTAEALRLGREAYRVSATGEMKAQQRQSIQSRLPAGIARL